MIVKKTVPVRSYMADVNALRCVGKRFLIFYMKVVDPIWRHGDILQESNACMWRHGFHQNVTWTLGAIEMYIV